MALKRGTFVDLYLGEVITSEEAAVREASANRKDNYLFNLDKFGTVDNGEDPDELSADVPGAQEVDSKKEKPYVIDGRHCGNIARFINHSCDPNLVVFAVAGERRDGKIYDLALFTNRAIAAGEELTFSYSEPHPRVLDPNKAGEEYTPCHCGADNCIGYVFWFGQ
jgi:histone-lysine N-methyltransferase SUV39H